MTPQDRVGRRERAHETLAPFRARAMAATLNREEVFAPGDALPPLWHWFHALRVFPLARAGADGHEALGQFLPALPFPRRMWTGGSLVFHAPLRIGETVERVSTVEAVTGKTGRTGPIR
ncbi:MAG: hypothetical protein Kow0013_27640 [Pararhodobacter sp.]